MELIMDAYPNYLRSIPNAERLLEELDDLRLHGGNASFLCYDIDSLRKINRAYGRRVGDALLASIAEWTLGFPEGSLYRIDGDLFCIVFKDGDIQTVHQYAVNLESRLTEAWQLRVLDKPYDVFVRASIAVLGELECDYSEDLIDLLDQALEISRKERQITLFTATYDKMTREQLRLQMELKNCILSDMKGFHLAFQPIVDAATGTWQGLEALCRWESSAMGAIPPGIFIAEAEEMGLIVQLGEWVLNKALETCKALRLDEIDRFFVSVNVSALQVNRRHYVRSVMSALETHGYPPAKLALEITESMKVVFSDTTLAALDMLRAKGMMLMLDDFGSGYSGFSNLKNLSSDILKTDRSFIENIENDSYMQYFYYIMSETAHASGMRLVAEGIETMAQLQSVVKNGADLIQGYLFGKPMDSESIDRLRDHFSASLPEFKGWMTELVDFKHWIHSQVAYQITPSLFGLQNKCIGILLDEADIDLAFNSIMCAVGQHFNVNRVYVFLKDEGQIFSNRYEWCAEGVAAQKHLFQQVDGSLNNFYTALRDNEVVMASNVSELPPNLLERLDIGQQEGSVRSIVVMPMKQKGEILGFVGFDDRVDRDWMPEELIILHNLCLLCVVKLSQSIVYHFGANSPARGKPPA